MTEIFQDVHIRSCLAELLSRYPIIAAYLYGSVARGQATPLSDLDIALVVYEDKLPRTKRLKFELEVEERVVEQCGLRRAELRVINDAPIIIRGEIVTDGILLYCQDDEARIEFETRTRSAYFDFLPFAGKLAEDQLEQMHFR